MTPGRNTNPYPVAVHCLHCYFNSLLFLSTDSMKEPKDTGFLYPCEGEQVT